MSSTYLPETQQTSTSTMIPSCAPRALRLGLGSSGWHSVLCLSSHITCVGKLPLACTFFCFNGDRFLLISLLNFQQVFILLSMLPSLQQNPLKKGKVRRLGANYTPSRYTSSSRNESCFGARLPARTDPRRAEVAAFRSFGHLYCSYFKKPAEAQSRKYSSR